MRKGKATLNLLAISLLIGLAANPMASHAQLPMQNAPLRLVTSFGPGGIVLQSGKDWKPELFNVYDNGRRPVAQFSNAALRVNVSYILFENLSGKPDSEGCRADAIEPIVHNGGSNISKKDYGESTTKTGRQLATASFIVEVNKAGIPHQRNQFGFAGNSKTCAEIHISAFGDEQAVQDGMNNTLEAFQPELDYQPTAIDYFRVASLLFKGAPALSAPYYRASIEAMPSEAGYLTMRRVATDQLVMALGMSGDLKGSRRAAENAIAADPDYPLNYYNLACADAEQGDATNAKLHLQKAFELRANILKGERMPDPARDDSILKLKSNREFWTFVQSLPQ